MQLMLSRCWLIHHIEFVIVVITVERERRSHSRQCIMITGDNPLTALHIARDVEIVDREALILDLKENPAHEKGE
jgi:magnesium-transporting ATPase (P-type)